MDKISVSLRSKNMSRISSKNTRPELILRKYLYSLGKRYRLHYPLPGKPDIVFLSTKTAVFVNGCFWHGHGCKVDHLPKSNTKFWAEKIFKNKERDSNVEHKLKTLGWKVIVIWECELTNNITTNIKTIFSP